MTTTTTQSPDTPTPSVERAPRWGDVTIGLISLATAAILLTGILTMEVRGKEMVGPEVFPAIVAGGLALLGLVLVISGFLPHRRSTVVNKDDSDPAHGDSPAQPSDRAAPFDLRAVLIAAGSIAVFALVLQVLGWIIASTLLFVAMTHAFGSRRPVFDLGVGFSIACITQLLFGGLLGLALPAGFVGGFF